jgi:hypothetical protein
MILWLSAHRRNGNTPEDGGRSPAASAPGIEGWLTWPTVGVRSVDRGLPLDFPHSRYRRRRSELYNPDPGSVQLVGTTEGVVPHLFLSPGTDSISLGTRQSELSAVPSLLAHCSWNRPMAVIDRSRLFFSGRPAECRRRPAQLPLERAAESRFRLVAGFVSDLCDWLATGRQPGGSELEPPALQIADR